MYVTDSANSRASVFTRDGAYITQWGSTGDALNNQIGIAVRPVGHVLVVDYGNSRVVVYAPDGTFLTAFGSGGDGPGQFSTPYGIAVDAGGVVYVTDIGNDRIQTFTLDQ